MKLLNMVLQIYILRIIKYVIILLSLTLSQELPFKYYENVLSKLYYDRGIGWNHISHFGPIRMNFFWER